MMDDIQEKSVESTRAFSSRISDGVEQQRIDLYLSKKFRYFSRQKWQQIIKAGRVQVEGRLISPSHQVKPGDTVIYSPSPEFEPDIDRTFDVLYEDEHVLAINKPAPCPTTQCGGYLFNTVDFLVGEYLRGKSGSDYWMMHRLDIETSGVLLIAKSKEGQSRIYAQFESRCVQKSYVALTRKLAGGQDLINHFQELPLGDDEESMIRIKAGVRFHPPCKSALTYFTTLSSSDSYALVRCRLYTGRTNQIRIHLIAAGHWIIGDKLYAEDEHIFDRHSRGELTDEDQMKLESSRLFLHADEMRLIHPVTLNPILIRAPLRQDMGIFASRVGLSV